MPLGQEVLIPHPELLAVGSARGGALTPDIGPPRTEGGVDDVGDRLTQRLFANVAAKDIADIGDVFSVVAIGDAFEAGVCTESV